MSSITIDDVREGQSDLNQSSLDEVIPSLITEAEDLLIAQLSYLSDAESVVRPTNPTETQKVIDLMILWQTRARSFESYFGSVENEQVKTWDKKYDDMLKDIRKGYVTIATSSTRTALSSVEIG